MDYKRKEIDAIDIDDLLPKGYKFYRLPELPKIEFKVGKVRYSVTDIRFLNENVVRAIEVILNKLASGQNDKEVTFKINDGVSKSAVDIITDILMGIHFSATKCGRNGFYKGACFIYGSYLSGFNTENENCKTVTYCVNEKVAKAVYEYAKEHESFNWYELVVKIFEKN